MFTATPFTKLTRWW